MSPPPQPHSMPNDPPEDPQGSPPPAHLTPPIDSDRQTLTSLGSTDSRSSASKPVSSLVGMVINEDYELLQEVGRGGMGIVYKAHQKSLNRVVAIKTLLAHHFTHPAILQRFLGEARASAGLTHPNIVKVFQVGECSAGHFFAMEFIDGRTLKEILQERTAPIPWSVALTAVVAEAIHHAHQEGIIHRDLKPSNIMIDRF